MSQKKSGISTVEIKRVLKDNYNFSGSFERLDGEIDYNYRLKSSDKIKYLLKISG
jgi:Ser/Thr protein kinase RdoA (MazF antagonist)